jgi:hypothetical protein
MAIFVMTTRNATTTNVDQMASLCPKYFQHRLSGKSLSPSACVLLRAIRHAQSRFVAPIRAARLCRQPDFNPVSFIQ